MVGGVTALSMGEVCFPGNQLAATIGVDAQGLVDTVATYNGCCEAGEDLDFRRGAMMCGDLAPQPNANLCRCHNRLSTR